MKKLLRTNLTVIGLLISPLLYAETPAYVLDSPSWCHDVILTEVGKTVTLKYCNQRVGPRCTHIDNCNPEFGTVHRDEFTFSRDNADKVTVQMKPQSGPSIPQVSCCSSRTGYAQTMTIRPSVSRAYDPTVNTPSEMCGGFFGPDWHECEI